LNVIFFIGLVRGHKRFSLPAVPCYQCLPMSESKQTDGALDLSIIKVHVMMPGALSSRESTYVSIKYSETTTAEEVINHIRKKKVRFFVPSIPCVCSCIPAIAAGSPF
jgi:hypothetical protein